MAVRDSGGPGFQVGFHWSKLVALPSSVAGQNHFRRDCPYVNSASSSTSKTPHAHSMPGRARRLRKKGQAHVGRAGPKWLLVNFPTDEEEAYAVQQGIPQRQRRQSEFQGFKPAFVGVSVLAGPSRQSNRWTAAIGHNGAFHNLGYFIDEQDTARAFDEAARRLQKKGQAHGGRSHTHLQRLKFPTGAEKAFANGKGLPPLKKQKVKAYM